MRLLESTLARAGNPEYAEENHSFGLTTLLNRHVRVSAGRIELDFRAKHGIRHHSIVSSRKLARIVKHCRDLPGSELFQYIDDMGTRHSIDSADLNSYLREASGQDVTAKDFRTWAGTNLAVLAIAGLADRRPSQKLVARIVRSVAEQLGNTPAVCRKCYIHPDVLSSYLEGKFESLVSESPKHGLGAAGIHAVEGSLLRFLATCEAARNRRRKVPRSMSRKALENRGRRVRSVRRPR